MFSIKKRPSSSSSSFYDQLVAHHQAVNFLSSHIEGIDIGQMLADIRRGRARGHDKRAPFTKHNGKVYYRLRDLLPLIETNRRSSKNERLSREVDLDQAPVVLGGAVSDSLPVVSMSIGSHGLVLPADEAEALARAIIAGVKEARGLATAKTGGVLAYFKKSA